MKVNFGHQIKGVLMKIKLIIFFVIISFGYSKAKGGLSLTNLKWVSEGNPKNEVWFQDWSGYVRLFVTKIDKYRI